MPRHTKFQNSAVKNKFNTYPEEIKTKLLLLRSLIFNVAAYTPKVGKIEETLKWGEPSYLTAETKSGSTIRIDWKESSPSQYVIYFNCKTTLIDSFKEIYGNIFDYSGNRAIVFNAEDSIPISELEDCVAMALTYHLK